jgi:hypothetical protein
MVVYSTAQQHGLISLFVHVLRLSPSTVNTSPACQCRPRTSSMFPLFKFPNSLNLTTEDAFLFPHHGTVDALFSALGMTSVPPSRRRLAACRALSLFLDVVSCDAVVRC